MGFGQTGAPGHNGIHGAAGVNGQTGVAGAARLTGPPAASRGGGVFVNAGSVSIEHSTVAANSGTLLSGEFDSRRRRSLPIRAGGLTAASSLFGSVSDPDFAEYAGHVSAVNSLFQSTRGVGLTGTNNLVGVDPLLSTSGLRNNGGPVQTVALQRASPAIGQTGNPQGFLTDGRGDALPASVSLDIGNYQTRRSSTKRLRQPRSQPPT